MTQNHFVGTWRLVSCELRGSDGQVSYPLGQDAVGYIIYTEDGYMSVAMMAAKRLKFGAGEIVIAGGTDEEKVAAADTYLSYCGKYEIQGEKVVHHIEVSFFPNWVGVDQERIFEFDGNTLSLSTPPFIVGGRQQTAHLIWQRV